MGTLENLWKEADALEEGVVLACFIHKIHIIYNEVEKKIKIKMQNKTWYLINNKCQFCMQIIFGGDRGLTYPVMLRDYSNSFHK